MLQAICVAETNSSIRHACTAGGQVKFIKTIGQKFKIHAGLFQCRGNQWSEVDICVVSFLIHTSHKPRYSHSVNAMHPSAIKYRVDISACA